MKVLLAVDGSFESDMAGELLRRLPLESPELTVATVVQPPYVAASPFGPTIEAMALGTLRLQEQIADRLVVGIAEELSRQGIPTSPRVLSGDPASQILDLVGDEPFDLVASGSGAKTDLQAFLLGSVARKLVSHAPCSVLLGRRYDHEEPKTSVAHLQKRRKLDLLVALDRSKESALAVEFLGDAPRGSFGTVYAMHVTSSDGSAGMVPDEDTAFVHEIAAKLIGSAEATVDMIEFGDPATAIVNAATERKVDLIVLGAARHGTIERHLAGSCAFDVATRAKCSVLIVRNHLRMAER